MSHGKLSTNGRLIRRNPMRAAIFVACLIASFGMGIELHGQEPAVDPKGDPAATQSPKLSLDDLNRLTEERANWIDGHPPRIKFPLDAAAVFKVQDQWAFYLKRPKVVTNSIGMKLALIPPGQFLMGSKYPGLEDGPAHDVTISRPFYIGVYEVTQREYESVIGHNPSGFAKGQAFGYAVAGLDTSRFPVEGVNYADAIQFCREVSARDEEKQAGRVYRLPTEAEWEYACRAGTTTRYHFGDASNGRESNIDGNYSLGTTTKGPYLIRTTTVGSYPANGWGLLDMHGNVWEWCQDWYDETYYQRSPRENPQGPDGAQNARVLRGGSWSSYARVTRSAYRGGDSPGNRHFSFGFRLARTP